MFLDEFFDYAQIALKDYDHRLLAFRRRKQKRYPSNLKTLSDFDKKDNKFGRYLLTTSGENAKLGSSKYGEKSCFYRGAFYYHSQITFKFIR